MKTIHRSLILSVLPLLSPLAMAEPETLPKEVKATDSAKKDAGAAWRASEVIGTSVKNAQDETIGEVKDLIVDLKSGEIWGVVVSTGGFLGISDTLSSIPSSALRYDVNAKGFKTKLTKEQLSGAPQFKNDAWPVSGDAAMEKLKGWRDSIGGDTTAPDNSAQNEKDRDAEHPTPVDQGNSDADIKTTKDIRMAVVGADLSFNAKNIKIITSDGKVTLRGVVDSNEEHKAVVDLAKKNAGAATIADHLEVKNTAK